MRVDDLPAHPFEVGRHAEHAMRIDTAQIGGHQTVRNGSGIVGRNPGMLEQCRHEAAQQWRGNQRWSHIL
jgi:hypothetical protein